jgi:PKD domain
MAVVPWDRSRRNPTVRDRLVPGGRFGRPFACRPRLEWLEDRTLPATWVPMPIPPDSVLPLIPPGAPTPIGQTAPTPYFLRGIWGNNGHDVFAVGGYRTILHYDGTAWTPQGVLDPTTNTISFQDPHVSLFGVWGITASGQLDVFAVGSVITSGGAANAGEKIYHYSSSDPVWREMAAPSPTGGAVSGLWGTSRNDVYAVGAGGVVAHYDGTTWTTLPTHIPSGALYRIWGNPATGDLVVAASVGAFHSADRGATWQAVNLVPNSVNITMGVWGTDSGDVFVAGAAQNPGASALVAHSSDSGANWPQVWTTPTNTLPSAPVLSGIAGRNAQDIFAVGGGGAINGVVFTTSTILHYDGVGWTAQPSGTSNRLSDVWAGGPYAFAVGVNGTIVSLRQTAVFDSLSSPTIIAGTATVTLSGHIVGESDVPPGSVQITLDGVTQSAAIDPTTGTFTSVFVTAGLTTAASPYTITYNYAGDVAFSTATDTTKSLTVVPDHLTVTNTADSGAGSLRDAITFVDAHPVSGGRLRIIFDIPNTDPGYNAATGAFTIRLTSALPDLNTNVEIRGPGAARLTVRRDTGGDYTVFRILGGSNVALDGLTISNGFAGNAGGIFNQGTLTISNTTLSGNSASGFGGGGIYNLGTLIVSNSTLSDNFIEGLGGGISNLGILTVSNSTLSHNSATSEGGGILNYYGTLTVSNSTLLDNSAPAGGGIYSTGTMTVRNTTLSGNSAQQEGGGIVNVLGTLTVTDSTFAANIGGGIRNFNGGTLTVSTSTFVSNTGFTFSGLGTGSTPYSTLVGSGIYNTEGGVATVRGSTFSDNSGSAIFNYRNVSDGTVPTVIITGSTFSGNQAGAGGGIWNYSGNVQVDSSTFSHNSASGLTFSAGGGIDVYPGGRLTVSNSTFSDNQAGYDAAGVYVSGSGGYGGGISISDNYAANATIINSTFSGNRSFNYGGGMFQIRSTVTVTSSTFFGNSATTNAGGGIWVGDVGLTIGNTIIAGNTGPAGPNVLGPVTSNGYNLIANTSGSNGFGATDLLGLSPMLAPLGDYGGSTPTMALLPGSPAIDAGGNALVPVGVTTDQRGVGYARVKHGTVDIGAFEFNHSPFASAGGPYTIMEGGSLTLDASASSDPDGDPLTYSWDVNGDGVFGDATGVNPTLTRAQLVALGINDGPHTNAVKVRVSDGIATTGSDSISLTVINAPPTATLGNNGPVNEGSPATISFTGSFDDSGADAAAGFQNSFALSAAGLANSYATAGTAPSANFTFADNGDYTVYGRIFDKDGGYSDYQTTVHVNNVAPTNVSLSTGAGSIDENGSTTLSGGFTDPGVQDTHTIVISWGDGSADTTLTLPPGVLIFGGLNHQYLDNPAGQSNGNYSIGMTVTDKDGDSGNGGTSIQVRNVAPGNVNLALTVGSIYENASTTLSGTFTDSGTQDTHAVVINWGDGSPNTTVNLAVGVLSFGGIGHQYLDNPAGQPNGSFPISVTITDKDGGAGSGATAVQVNNAPPGFQSSTSPGNGVPGQPRNFTFGASDGSPADQAAGFSYAINWGDGTPVQTIPRTAGNGSGVAMDHVFPATGSFTVQVAVTDKDGGSYGFVLTFPFTVMAAQLQGPDLAVGGTSADDAITLSPADAAGNITVAIKTGNKTTTYGPFLPAGHIFVYGQAGNDTIGFGSPFTSKGTKYYVAAPAVIYGGDGNDTINANNSTANNVLFGGAGDDSLTGNDTTQGGQGRDLLIGGAGADNKLSALTGGDSILIGGTTDYDLENTALTYDKKLAAVYAVMTEWGRTDVDYATRVQHLSGTLAGGLNGSWYLNSSTVHGDGAANALTGSAVAMDWFFVNISGQDTIKNWRTGEVITNV